MFEVTDSARDELVKVFDNEQAKNKELVLYFQGYG